MRFTFATVAASLLATAQARLVGFAMPDTVNAGEVFDLTLLTENYIQSIQDVSIAFGCAPGAGIPESLGLFQQSVALGPSKSNQLHNVTVQVSTPATFPQGSATCSVSLFSLIGVQYMPILTSWNASVTFADETSDDLVFNN